MGNRALCPQEANPRPDTRTMKKRHFKRGDKVEWGNRYGTRKAVFVEYDQDMPTRFVILATRIGAKGNRMVHTFRWPLSGTRKLM